MKSIEVVAAIISDEAGRIFATQRGYGDWKDWWEFPGGKMEAGETPEQALRREIREELDAEIEVGELLRTIDYDYPAFHLTMHCFMCRLQGHVTLLEHEAAKWLAPSELTSVHWLPADEEIIEILSTRRYMYEHSNIERHPLQPFMPHNAQILMLGSFPPPKERWCMEFFYPNPQNDMWRIMGLAFFGDKEHFVEQRAKAAALKEQGTKSGFRYEEIVAFCKEKGIAIFDTAQAVIRLQGNAADEHLEIVEQNNVAALLQQLPYCHDLCCTGGKAAQTLAEILHCPTPKVGEYIETDFACRTIRFWRMPSSSRAYPLSLDKKTAAYRRMFETIGML